MSSVGLAPLMHLTTPGIMLTVRAHGEHGAVVRMLTETNGVVAAYVHGGRSRKTRPLLVPANHLSAQLDTRGEHQLATARLELVSSRAALALDPLLLAMTEWLTMLVAESLPEGEAFPAIFDTLSATLTLMDAQPETAQLAATLARFELKLLGELGFRLDLDSCAATGATENLIYISPKSGRAVSAEAGAAYKEKLFSLPRFLVTDGATPVAEDIFAALRVTRHFIARDLLPATRAEKTLAARDRVDARLRKRF